MQLFDFNNSFKCCVTMLAAFIYENRAMFSSLGFERMYYSEDRS